MSHIITNSNTKFEKNLEFLDIGDICNTEFSFKQKNITLILIYISSGTSKSKIKKFLNYHLLSYSKLNNLIVFGDFNLNINKNENTDFINFMLNNFNLHLNNNYSIV